MSIVGAGPGGLAAARLLLASRQVDVTLIQPEGIVTFLPGILPVLLGMRSPESYRQAIELDGVRVLAGTVAALETGRLWLTDGTVLAADAIIAAPGLLTDATAIPTGVRTFPVWELEHAAAARPAVADVAPGRLVVAIAALPYRCPPAPYGLAMALASHFREQQREVEVIVTTPETRSLQQLGERVSGFIEQLVSASGVALETGLQPNLAASRDGLLVAEDGRQIPYELGLFIPPHRRHPFLEQVDGVGPLVQVDAQQRTSMPGVWAIGDAAATPLPRAAGVAEAQGRTAAQDVLASFDLLASQPPESPTPSCYVWTGHASAARIQITFPSGLLPAGAPAFSLEPPSSALGMEALDARTRWLEQLGGGA